MMKHASSYRLLSDTSRINKKKGQPDPIDPVIIKDMSVAITKQIANLQNFLDCGIITYI